MLFRSCVFRNHACFRPKSPLFANSNEKPRCNYCRKSRKGCKFPPPDDTAGVAGGSSPVKGSSGGSKESTVGKSGGIVGAKRKAPPAPAESTSEGRSVKSRTGTVPVPARPVVMLPPRGRAQLPSVGSLSSYPSPRFGLGELPFGSASSSRLSLASIPTRPSSSLAPSSRSVSAILVALQHAETSAAKGYAQVMRQTCAAHDQLLEQI